MFHLQQNFKHMQSDISQLGEEISVKMEQSFITAEENIEETKKQIGQTDIFNDTKYLPKNKSVLDLKQTLEQDSSESSENSLDNIYIQDQRSNSM
jgi:hypothetical protein